MARIAAIIAGLGVMFSLEHWAGYQWYSALALGVLSYALVRYAGYFVNERRHISGVKDAAKRDQISN
jgi:hypothetical protein